MADKDQLYYLLAQDRDAITQLRAQLAQAQDETERTRRNWRRWAGRWKELAARKRRVIRDMDIEIDGAMNDYERAKSQLARERERVGRCKAALSDMLAQIDSYENWMKHTSATKAARRLVAEGDEG